MTPERLEELRKLTRLADETGDAFSVAMRYMLAEIDRLDGIVAKLPIYADTGQPFVPGRESAWCLDPGGLAVELCDEDLRWQDKLRRWFCDWSVDGKFYSAAASAKEGASR